MDLTSAMVQGFRLPPGRAVRLDAWPTRWDIPPELQDLDTDELKQEAADFVAERAQELANLQDVLWADGRHSVLIIFQGLDASGKDSTIRHVTSGINPAGIRVVSFKEPSPEELRRNYLWRYLVALPEQGHIGIFNRSYYEEVTVVRVKPELLRLRAIPERAVDESLWRQRYEDINSLEAQLVRNGTTVLKFFLHISKQEQKKRLMQRLTDPSKHWKFSPDDIASRERWADYQRAYEDALTATSTAWAPWWIMPADRKWAMRALVAQVILNEMRSLDLRYPPVDLEQRALIQQALDHLEKEQ